MYTCTRRLPLAPGWQLPWGATWIPVTAPARLCCGVGVAGAGVAVGEAGRACDCEAGAPGVVLWLRLSSAGTTTRRSRRTPATAAAPTATTGTLGRIRCQSSEEGRHPRTGEGRGRGGGGATSSSRSASWTGAAPVGAAGAYTAPTLTETCGWGGGTDTEG